MLVCWRMLRPVFMALALSKGTQSMKTHKCLKDSGTGSLSTELKLARQERKSSSRHSATLAGPPFDHTKFRLQLLKSFSLDSSHGCGDIIESELILEGDNDLSAQKILQPSFKFEGQKFHCGTNYEPVDSGHDECRDTCASREECKAFVVLENPKLAQLLSISRVTRRGLPRCLIYTANDCTKKYQTGINNTEGFIGAYSKAGESFECGSSCGKDPQTDLQRGQTLIRIEEERPSSIEGEVNFVQVAIPKNMKDVSQIVAKATSSNRIRLVFEAGVDSRGCWGRLEDWKNNAVCGADVFRDLITSIQRAHTAEFDKAGQSGSTLITNFDNFIIKNAQDDDEYDLIKRALPEFQKDILSRPDGCFTTALAPICGVIVEGSGKMGPTKWLLMRKIEIPDASRKKFESDDDKWLVKLRTYSQDFDLKHKVGWIDIKSPYFATWLRDGKTKLQQHGWHKLDGETEKNKWITWKHKDPGFVTLFPKGLVLKPTGSREASAALSWDTLMLSHEKMTDYSLFGTFYESTNLALTCEKGGPPRFPVLLEVLGDPRFYLAIGIIDYVEQTVRKWLTKLMSTMRDPLTYRELFMSMWPKYFKIPDIPFTVENNVGILSGLLENRSQPSEHLEVGMRVMAIQEIKWKQKTEMNENLPAGYKWYKHQMPVAQMLSAYKVFPGAQGELMLIEMEDTKPYIVVRWDENRPDFHNLHRRLNMSWNVKEAFTVFADQVMTWSGGPDEKKQRKLI